MRIKRNMTVSESMAADKELDKGLMHVAEVVKTFRILDVSDLFVPYLR